MDKKPRTLYRQPQPEETWEKELSITVKTVLIILLIVIIFGVLLFFYVPQTYGYF